jgi:TRAP-type mannitol/chloroaromatic compound transport system permease small subunit
MRAALSLAHAIDRFNDAFAWIAQWAIVLSCAISAGNAIVRYGINLSSNAWLEIQWYLFAAAVMFGAAQVLRLNEHVRVDLLYARYPTRMKVWIDLLGLALFMVPVLVAGGLIRWPVMLTMPLGFGLLLLQTVSEAIKRIGWLRHAYDMDTHYERPLQ